MNEIEEITRGIIILTQPARGSVVSLSVRRILNMIGKRPRMHYAWLINTILEGLGCQALRRGNRVKVFLCPRRILNKSQRELELVLARAIINGVRRKTLGDELIKFLSTSPSGVRIIKFNDFINYLRSNGYDGEEVRIKARSLWSYSLKPVLEGLTLEGIIKSHEFRNGLLILNYTQTN